MCNLSNTRRQKLLFGLFCLLSGALSNPLVFKTVSLATFTVPVLSALMLICLTLAFVAFRWFFAAIIVVVYLLSGLGAYFGHYFSVLIKYDSIVWLLEVSPGEIKSFMTPVLCAWLGCAVMLAFAHIRLASFLRRLSYGGLAWRLAACVALSIGLQSGVAALAKHGVGASDMPWLTTRDSVKTRNITPFSMFKVFHVLAGEMQLIHSLNSLDSLADMPFEAPPPHEQPVVIFVVGESARADNFGINGYPRDTTPRLSREKNLINYGVARSFATSTRRSHLGMMTDATQANPRPRRGPVIPLYNAAGFSSFTWSVQGALLSQSAVVGNTLTAASHVREHVKGRDHSLLPKVLQALDKPSSGGKFITLITNGSHAKYSHQYGEEFRIFTPDDYTNENMLEHLEQVRNAYDNTVLQTDDLLGRLIDMLRDRLAVLIYASDHGESLGEGGEVMHGGEGKAEHWRIPFFIWHSDAYARQYPEIVAGLRDHVGQSISHDHLYHTVIGLGGLRSAGVDPELDLTNRAGLSKEVKASR